MDLLKKLCETNAVSGNEFNVASVIENYLKTFSDNIFRDGMGNIVAEIGNRGKVRIMLEAHIDQIGLVVKSIDENGFVKFIKSGGINSSILPTAEVVIHGKKDIYGVIGAKPPHLQTEKDKKLSDSENMYIDCGYSFDEIKKYVDIGDTISLSAQFSELKNGNISSKSLDNRIGVYVVAKCLEELAAKNLPYKLAGVFSVQEEVGCRGSVTAAERLNPDYAVVVDVTFGVSPYTTKEDGFETGKGITVAVGPNLDRETAAKFIELCKGESIKFEKEVCAANTGTDAWPIQVAADGVKCVLVSVPVKYMHTTVETASRDDILSAVCAIVKAIEGGVFDA